MTDAARAPRRGRARSARTPEPPCSAPRRATGVLHATGDLVVAGVRRRAHGRAARRARRRPTRPSGRAAPSTAIALDGDAGPGGSGVLALGALPFDADAPHRARRPVALLAAWHPGDAAAWVTEVARRRTAPRTRVGAVPPRSPMPPTPRLERASRLCDRAPVRRGVRRRRASAASSGSGAASVDKVVLARVVAGRCRDADRPAGARGGAAPPRPGVRPLRLPRRRRPVRRGEPRARRRDRRRRGQRAPARRHRRARRRPRRRGPGRVAPRLGEEPRRARRRRGGHRRAARAAVRGAARRVGAVGRAAVDRTRASGRGSTASSAAAATPRRRSLACSPRCTRRPRSAACRATRALELIGELEAAPRGPWAGPVGWVDADGTSTWTLGLRGDPGRGRPLRGLGWRGDRGGVRARRRARRDRARSSRSVLRVLQPASTVRRARSGRSSAQRVTSSSASTTIALDIFDVPWTRSMKVIGTSLIDAPARARPVGHLDLEGVARRRGPSRSRSARARCAGRRGSPRSSPRRGATRSSEA